MTTPDTTASSQPKKVLSATLAGSWYDSRPEVLHKEFQSYLDNAKEKPVKNVCALILPHAGYRFSGPTAAYGLKLLEGKTYKRVVVMGPSHRLPMENWAALPEATHYSSPMGEIPMDTAFIQALESSPLFRRLPEAFPHENSIEMQIPFLQDVLDNDFMLVPIVVGQLDTPTAKAMGQVLASLCDEETLVISSTDFTHYGPRFQYTPFSDNIPENIRKLDLEAFAQIQQKNLTGFFEFIHKTKATICGRCPVGILLGMLPDDATVTLLQYETSGDITGDYSNPVSYLAAAISGQWTGKAPTGVKPAAPVMQTTLNDADKASLLNLARATLTHYLKTKKAPTPEELEIAITPGMEQVMGAFVTLHKDGQLRGCIGEIFPRRPLYQAVMEQAINAGVNDYRFRQVTAPELSEIDFEISALTPPHAVDSYEDIVIGKHGMVLKKQGRQAVFLPQVAPEQGWDLATTLTHLSMKAGLPADAWKSGADYLVFEAIVFHEPTP